MIQYDWYQYQGRLEYLKEQRTYLISLLDHLSKFVDTDGREKLEGVGMRFLDWPSYHDKKAVHAGLQAMLVMTLEKGASLCKVLGEKARADAYLKLASKMRTHIPDANNSKQAASLLALAGMRDVREANQKVISVDGAKRFGTFFGYYMLKAQARAADYQGAMDNIRKFWGGMLDLGATTWWEEFDLEEASNAAPIDNFIPAGKKDYHASTGAECYRLTPQPLPWLVIRTYTLAK